MPPTPTDPEQKPQRVLACALCKQRRVKCNRSFPCENCVRAGVECVQPTVHQRRRRFAERALLDRLHHYEYLLKQNHVAFEPLHGSDSASAAVSPRDYDDDDAGYPVVRRNKDKEAMFVSRYLHSAGQQLGMCICNWIQVLTHELSQRCLAVDKTSGMSCPCRPGPLKF